MAEFLLQIFYAVPIAGVLFGVALLMSKSGRWRPDRLIAMLERFLERPLRGYLAIICIALTALILTTLWTGIPLPAVHDEFSYLLAADTFAHGRITNPTPHFWEHFETFHVLLQPTYMSKYPPGQGLFLAVGQVLWHPILGVWLSAVLASAACYGMLRVWFSSRSRGWAFVGGTLFALHPLLTRWGHLYWGGSVAAFGGALLFGNARYLLYALEGAQASRASGFPFAELQSEDALRLRSIRLHAFGMGTGIWILANSRPFEGLVLTICILLALLRSSLKSSASENRATRRAILLPSVLCLLCMTLQIGYYNYRITGSPLTFSFR